MKPPPEAIKATVESGRVVFMVPGAWPSKWWVVGGAVAFAAGALLALAALLVVMGVPIVAALVIWSSFVAPVAIAAIVGTSALWASVIGGRMTIMELEPAGFRKQHLNLYRLPANVAYFAWDEVRAFEVDDANWWFTRQNGNQFCVDVRGWPPEIRDQAEAWFRSMLAEMSNPDHDAEAVIDEARRALARRATAT